MLLLLACTPIPSAPLPDVTPDTGEPSADTADTAAPVFAPALYADDQIHSPITPWVADVWRETAGVGQADVFMKIGASSTASSRTLHCFAEDDETDLGAHTELEDALLFFRGGDAAGSTPFDRDTEAAVSGMSAGWAISGDPSPVDLEIDAIAPRYAIVHYGTNDMGLGSTYDSAMPGFYRNMTALLDGLMDAGILPVLTGISPRGDSEAADEWAETYNALIRGLAQARQLPLIDLHLATDGLDEHGLSSDGLHLSYAPEGACMLTEAGLQYGYNVRNLIVLQALDRLHRVLIEADTPDEGADILTGEGSAEDPFAIPGLPFADTRSTTDSPHTDLDVYTGCDYDADESGPEWTYTLTLTEPTAIRAIVLDDLSVDIDLHILSEGGGEDDCHLRADRTVETTLSAGTWRFVLDTYVSSKAYDGEYLFFIQTCEPGDADCL